MPPAPQRDISVIVFDLDKSDPKLFEERLSFIIDISSREWFFHAKNSTKLILLNSEKTRNSFKKDNIFVTEGFNRYDPKILKKYIEETNHVVNKTSWINGLHVGLYLLDEELKTLRGIVSAQVLLVSNNFTGSENKNLNSLIEIQKRNKIKIIITGLSVSVGFINDLKELKIWAKDPVICDDIGETDKRNLKTLCQQGETLVCDLKMGRELFFSFRKKRRMQSWYEPLSIGPNIKIPTITCKFLKQQVQPSYKVQFEDRNAYFWAYASDTKKQVAYNDLISGVFRWGKFIGFDDSMKQYFKVKGPRSFRVLGFADKNSITESLILGTESSVLAANIKVKNSEKFVYLFYKTLLESNKVCIASKTYMANCQPRMIALVPDAVNQIITVNVLPYAQDVIHKWSEKDPQVEIPTDGKEDEFETEQEKEIFEFINSLKVPSDPNFNLSPRLRYNPKSALLTRRIAEKYLGGTPDLEKGIELPNLRASSFEEHFPEVEEVEKRRVVNFKKKVDVEAGSSTSTAMDVDYDDFNL